MLEMRKAKIKKWITVIVSLATVMSGFDGFLTSVKAENQEVEQSKTVSGSDSVYTDGTQLYEVKKFNSPGGNLSVKIMKDDTKGRYFYSVSNDGECVIQASRLGINTVNADFTEGAAFEEVNTPIKKTEQYVLHNGKHDGEITDEYMEYSFVLKKDGKELVVTVRAFDDGTAYKYDMNEGADIISEASEYVFSDDAVMWTYAQPNLTYEGTYTEIAMTTVYKTASAYTSPSLIKTGSNWILITEASVFDDEESYCSSYFKTSKDSKNLVYTFGNKQNGNVVMKNAFETPWRVAVIGENLNTVANSDIVTSVCKTAADIDYSFVKPGRLAWSWWSSTGDNPIAFEPQYEYIDFAAENGWEYVCLDYGWVLWDNYKEKVKELIDYADEKGVGIWLWYGVNNVGHSAAGAYPKYSLLNEETIKTELEWAGSIGIKGVKVDYYESDNQSTMKQMYLCAKIAAENKLMVLFHGCTNPGGENRTFPNVLSYEAVYGAEYYKWRTEPSAANIITYLFTRNAVGSADFTPACMPVAGVDATCGFMLGTAIYLESGLVHFAENVNVYEGYKGLSLMNDMPVTWNESIVLEGYPGKYGTVARRSGSEWYLAALTTEARNTDISLDFLEAGRKYTAYIYKSDETGTDIEIFTEEVENTDRLRLELGKDDGVTVKITAETFETETSYEKEYYFYEAEKAELSGKSCLATNLFNAQYFSGGQAAEYIGNGSDNAVTYNIEAGTDGIYEINIYYISGNDRRFMISVNGDDENRIRTAKLNSGDWVTVKKETVYMKLNSGFNIIKFYNETAYAPNLDRISISKSVKEAELTVSDETEDIQENIIGADYDYDIYEAEKAVIANGATNEGTLVGWIGGNSYVLFENIEVETDGRYYLMLQYMTAVDRDFEVSVNEGEVKVINCPSSGDYYSNPAVVYVEAELKAGTNTIKVFNSHGDAPNLDCIGISKKPYEVMLNEDSETDGEADKEDKNYTLPCMAAGAALVIIIAAAVIIRNRKKKTSTFRR